MGARKKPAAPEKAVSVVLVTAPDEAAAATIARTLVDERLIACANLVPKIRSIFRWKGVIHDADEVLIVMKTRSSSVEALIARVKALHSYTVPEVLELPVRASFEPYLDWVWQETAPEEKVVRRFHLKPVDRIGAFKTAIDALGGVSESVHIRVDMNEYQDGTIWRFPDGSGVCVMNERTDVAPQDDFEVELWAHGATRADALQVRVMGVAASAGVTT